MPEMESETKGWIRAVPLRMTPPSLQDNRADADRLLKHIEKVLAAEEVTVDLPLVRRMPSLLREWSYATQAVLYRRGMQSWHLMGLAPGGKEPPMYGLAVDFGTTTVVAELVDLSSGEVRREASFLNPQVEIGPDILTRIQFAEQEGGLERLQGLVTERLNLEIGRMAAAQGISVQEIWGVSAAGNTTMTHLFLGLDPYWIRREPYIPVINRPGLLRASELGLCVHPEAPLLIFPNVGSYFGGDLIAGILASGMAHEEEASILVDVGTNAEVALGNRDWLMACAGAAGPALEGGVAGMGMTAGPGVIDRVCVDPATGEFTIRTIGGKPAVGICGSGLIDLAAQLFLAGMIDVQGRFLPMRCGDRLRDMDGVMRLIVVPSSESGTGEDLTLSQVDIDGLIRSKAAMYTILTTVTRAVHLSMKDIRTFYVAGTFGSYIDPRSAIVLGMIPDLPAHVFKPMGNSSIQGARLALLSLQHREEVFRIRDRVTYMELNVNQEFMQLYSAARFIPHTDGSLFPSVGIGREN